MAGRDVALNPDVPLCLDTTTQSTLDRVKARPWDIEVGMGPLTLQSFPADRSRIASCLRPALRFLAVTQLPPPRMDTLLPPARDPKAMTLVLDLDETLVHCDKGFAKFRRHVRVRPHARAFLEAVAGRYEVVVFTASTQGYADSVLDQLDPERTLVHFRLYRESCSVNVHGGYFKDLKALGRPMDKVLLVDNSLTSLALQPDHGVPIRTWTEDPEDTELIELLPFLDELSRAQSVQPILRRKYCLSEFFDVLRSPVAAPFLLELSELD